MGEELLYTLLLYIIRSQGFHTPPPLTHTHTHTCTQLSQYSTIRVVMTMGVLKRIKQGGLE